jgi:membrane-associated phospholipid phosphatase
VRLSALDRWTLGYAAFATVAVLVHAERLPHPWLLVLGHGLLGAVALVAHRARARSGVVLFLGEFYPLVLVVILYAEIGHVNAVVGLSHDARVQHWEAALFGSQPSREWIRTWPLPWLSMVFHGAYLSYYFILAGAPLVPWAMGRTRAAAWVALLMAATFFLCYAVFLCFPVAGPRYTFPLADNEATRTALARFTQRLLNQGAAWGTAFPSSHVAVSLVASVAAARAWPALGLVLVPLALLLTLATVYGQFHYAVDALAGAAVAALVLAVGLWHGPTPEDRT